MFPIKAIREHISSKLNEIGILKKRNYLCRKISLKLR